MKKKPPPRYAYSAPSAVPMLLEVLRLIAKGYTNSRIGTELGITEDTVKCRAQALYRHLGARDRAHAVAIGYQRGLLSLGNHAPACPLRGPLVCRCKSGVDR